MANLALKINYRLIIQGVRVCVFVLSDEGLYKCEKFQSLLCEHQRYSPSTWYNENHMLLLPNTQQAGRLSKLRYKENSKGETKGDTEGGNRGW